MEEAKSTHHHELPLIGITTGDFNGIGPEIILKLLEDNRVLKLFTPVIYGSHKVLNYYRKLYNMEELPYFHIKPSQPVQPKRVNVVNCYEKQVEITPGTPNTESGRFALACLETAVHDLKAGHIHAVVTAPIHKATMPEDDFPFPGHTEYFAHHFGRKKPLMLMAGEKLRVATLTTHIPLDQVPSAITIPAIRESITVLHHDLKKYFNIISPKIGILGLNPHAGESGKIGNTEIEVIVPAINQLKEKGMHIFGPYPADAFFGAGHYKKFDAILAMYHDQALIPFKMAEFDTGVNITLGTDIIRTSPDHGTAFDIAGKNKANEQSLRAACFMALDMIRNSKSWAISG